MTDKFLPLTINVEEVKIRDVGDEWEVAIHTTDSGVLYQYVEMPDHLFDQLLEKEIITTEGL